MDSTIESTCAGFQLSNHPILAIFPILTVILGLRYNPTTTFLKSRLISVSLITLLAACSVTIDVSGVADTGLQNIINAITALSISSISYEHQSNMVMFQHGFSILSALNHLYPGKFKYGNNIVKGFLTPFIFQKSNHKLVLLIVISDLLPLMNVNGFEHFELLGALLRQCTIIKNIMSSVISPPNQEKLHFFQRARYNAPILPALIVFICKLLYRYERQRRIKRGTRECFSMLHNFEHIGLWLYFYYFTDKINTQKTLNKLVFILAFLTTSILFLPTLSFLIINRHIKKNSVKRLPIWFDHRLYEIFNTKVQKNVNSIKLYNYTLKPFSTYVNLEVMNWKRIELECDKLVRKINNSDFEPDLVIGVASGGAFITKYITDNLKTTPDIMYVRSKGWSGLTLGQTIQKIKLIKDGDTFKNINSKSNKEIRMLVSPPEKDYTQILILDDTIASGKTMKLVEKWTRNKYKNSEIKLAALILPNQFCEVNYNVDFYTSEGRVPIIWEWGVEVD